MKATNRSLYETVAKQDFHASGWVNFSAEPVPIWEDALLACFLFVFLNSPSAANSHVLAFRIESTKEVPPKEWKLPPSPSYLGHPTVYCSVRDTASPCCPSSLPNSNLRTQPSWVRRHLYVTPVNSSCSPFQLCFHATYLICHILSSSWESDPATQREKSWPVGTIWHASEKGSSSSVGNGLCLAHTDGSL